MTFEESTKKLDAIIESMQKRELTLDEAIAQFNEGVKVAEKCMQMLGESKGKIVEVNKRLEELLGQEENLF